jgi:fatty-acid desaturase
VNLLGHNEKFHDSHILSAIFAGEMYHEKHHASPNKEKMGMFDLPYWVVIKWLK